MQLSVLQPETRFVQSCICDTPQSCINSFKGVYKSYMFFERFSEKDHRIFFALSEVTGYTMLSNDIYENSTIPPTLEKRKKKLKKEKKKKLQ